MSKEKKITEKQLESIKEIQQKINAILLDVGYLEARKQDLILLTQKRVKKCKK